MEGDGVERRSWGGLLTRRSQAGRERGSAGTRASGEEASPLQGNHKRDVTWGSAGTRASGEAEGTVRVKALSPVGPWLPPTPQVAEGYVK